MAIYLDMPLYNNKAMRNVLDIPMQQIIHRISEYTLSNEDMVVNRASLIAASKFAMINVSKFIIHHITFLPKRQDISLNGKKRRK